MQIEVVIKHIATALQTTQLYGPTHQICQGVVAEAYRVVADALQETDEIVIGIVGDDLCFGKDILFEMSRFLAPTIQYLKRLGVEKITLRAGLGEEELKNALYALTEHKEQIKTDPVGEFSRLNITHLSIGKLKSGVVSKLSGRELDSGALYQEALVATSNSLEGVLSTGDLNYRSLRIAMVNILDTLSNYREEIFRLTMLKRYSPETGVHMTNVAVLAMHLASQLGLAHADVADIGIAALFHDIGKLYISRRILKKTETLSQDEFSQIRSHSALGAELLLKHVHELGKLPVVVAYEHHLRHDMSGYPKAPFLKKPHIASMIVSLCDVYDALFSRRSYKTVYTPEAVYDIMNKEKGRLFAPAFLDLFFQIMGVWHTGALLLLSDSSVAVVRQQNEDDIFAPCVEVFWPQEKRRSLDLRKVKEEVKVTRYLDPYQEGKAYLPLLERGS